MTVAIAALGLGANLGDARGALRLAVQALRSTPGIRVRAVSSLYSTAPVGGPAQPDYLNAVVVVSTELAPSDLLAIAQRLEAAAERTREVRWGPRTLDVDILAVAGIRSDDPRLLLPHPRAHERGFVLVPWAQIDPDFEVPGRGSVAALREALPASATADVVALEPASTWAPDEVGR